MLSGAVLQWIVSPICGAGARPPHGVLIRRERGGPLGIGNAYIKHTLAFVFKLTVMFSDPIY